MAEIATYVRTISWYHQIHVNGTLNVLLCIFIIIKQVVLSIMILCILTVDQNTSRAWEGKQIFFSPKLSDDWSRLVHWTKNALKDLIQVFTYTRIPYSS